MSELTTSQKAIWFARSSIMEVMVSLGMPSGVMDGSHIIVRGVSQQTTWLAAAADDRVAEALGSGNSKFKDNLTIFKMAIHGEDRVRTLAPIGISFSGSGQRARVDGAALAITMTSGIGYVIPASRTAMSSGSEWTEMVALIPVDSLPEWFIISQMAAMADRALDASRSVMRVYNGRDIPVSPIQLDDLVLDENVIRSFVDDITGFLGRRDWYHQRALPWKRSYLLNGPPGTGKTSLARWAASALGIPCLGFDFTDVYADGRTLNGCLAEAAATAPCLLVFDDIDKVLVPGGNRTGITPQSLQTALSGMGSLDGVIIIATSNSTSAIRGTLSDGSENPLARRFDQIITVPLPTPELRVAYATKLLKQDAVDPQSIQTLFGHPGRNGWSYDDIRAAVTAAANITVTRGAETINESDLLRGIASVNQRKSEPSTSMKADDDPEVD